MGGQTSKLSEKLTPQSFLHAYGKQENVYEILLKAAAGKQDAVRNVVGACDCNGGDEDMNGGDEDMNGGDSVAVHNVDGYQHSISASLKEKVIREVAAEIKKIMKNSDINPSERDLHTLSMQVYKALPNLAEGVTLVESDEVHQRSCMEAGKIINRLLGYTMVDTKAPTAEVCRQVAEIMLSFATGVHLEFARVYKEVENVLENLKTMHDALDAATVELRNSARVVTDIDTRSELEVYLKVFEKALMEAKRQRQVLENLISGSVRADAEGIELVMTDLDHITTLIKRLKAHKSSSKDMNEASSALLQLFGENLVLLSKVDKALKFLGMSVGEFKDASSAGELKDKLKQLRDAKFEKANPNELVKLEKYVKVLEEAFARRDRLLYGLGLMGGADSDTSVTTEESTFTRQIRKDVEARRTIMVAFNKSLFEIFDRILNNLEFYDKVGKTVPITDELERFANDVQRLQDFRKSRLYYSLIGLDKSASGRQYKETYLTSIKYLLDSVKTLSGMEVYRPIQQQLNDLKNNLEALMRLTEAYADKIKQTIGGDSIEEMINKDVPGISRSVVKIEETLEYFRYFIRVARIRENLKYTKEGLDAVNEDYNRLLAESIANKIKDLANDRDALLKSVLALPQFEPISTTGGNVTPQEKEARDKDREGVRDFINDVFKTKREFYEMVEAVELYLKEFTRLIVANPNNLMELKKMLDSVETIAKWFDDRSGEKLSAVFETFPAGQWRHYVAANPERFASTHYKDDETKSVLYDAEDSNKHYYQKLQTQIAGPVINIDDFSLDDAFISLRDPDTNNMARVVNTQVLAAEFNGAAHIGDRDLGQALTAYMGLANNIPDTFMGVAAGTAFNAVAVTQSVKDYVKKQLNIPIVKAFLLKFNPNVTPSEALQPIGLGFHLNPLRPAKDTREELEKKIKDAISKQSFLKNIIETFVTIGSMIGKEDLNKMPGMIPPVQLYNRMTNYLAKSNIDLGLFKSSTQDFKGEYKPIESLYNDVNSTNSVNWVYDGADDKRTFAIGTQLEPTANIGEVLTATDASVAGLATHHHDVSDPQKKVAHHLINHRGRLLHAGLILSTITSQPDTVDGVRVNIRQGDRFDKLFFEEDDIFVLLLKSIVTKVFTVVGLYDLLEKPFGHTSFSPLRMLIGGDDQVAPVKIYDDAVELYFRLPLLAEFYRELFSKDAFARVRVTDGSSLGMIPELSGPFGRLVEIIFKQADYVNTSTYSKTDTREIVMSVNDLYEKYRVKSPGNEVTQIIHDFVNEINKHYGVILEREMRDYDKLNIMKYTSRDIVPSDEYDYAILPNETEDALYVPPSTKLLDGQLASREPKYALQKAKINKIHRELIDKFRNNLNSFFNEEKARPGMSGNESYRHLFRNTNSKISKAKDEGEKYEIIENLIRGEDYMSLGEQLRLVLFHETVVTGLTSLHTIYNVLKEFKSRITLCDIARIEKLIDESFFGQKSIASIAGAIAPAGNLTRDMLAGNPQLSDDEKKMLVKYLINASNENNNSEIPNAGLEAERAAGDVRLIDNGGQKRISYQNPDTLDIKQLNAIFIVNQDGSLPVAVPANVDISPNDRRYKFFKRYVISRNDIVRDLIENVFGLSLQTNNLVEVKVGESIQLNYSGLVDKINEVTESVRYMLDYFRRVLPNPTLVDKYEDENYHGSFYWLQRHLIDNLIKGIKLDVKDTDADFRDVSLDKLNEIIANSYKICTSETDFGYDFIGGLTVAIAGGITQHNLVNLAHDDKEQITIKSGRTKANLNNAFAQLVYWNPTAISESTVIYKSDGKELSDSGFNDNTVDTKPSSFDNSAFQLFRFSHLYSHDEKLIDNNDGANNRLKRANRSLMTVFNQILAKYLNISYDHVSNKLYKPVVDELVNGVFNSSISTGNFYPDVLREPVQVFRIIGGVTEKDSELSTILNLLGFKKIGHNAPGDIGDVANMNLNIIDISTNEPLGLARPSVINRASALLDFKNFKYALAYYSAVKTAELAKNLPGATSQSVRSAAISAVISILGDEVVYTNTADARGAGGVGGAGGTIDVNRGASNIVAANNPSYLSSVGYDAAGGAFDINSLTVYNLFLATTTVPGTNSVYGTPLAMLLYGISSDNLPGATLFVNGGHVNTHSISCQASPQQEYEVIKTFAGMQFGQAIFNNGQPLSPNYDEFIADANTVRPSTFYTANAAERSRLLNEADQVIATIEKCLKICNQTSLQDPSLIKGAAENLSSTLNLTFNVATSNPTKAGIIHQSIGTFLTEIATTKVRVQGSSSEYKFLTDKLSEIPLAVQESYAVNLPLFEKMFLTLNKKASLLKQLLQNRQFDTSINSIVPQRGGVWVGRSEPVIPILRVRKHFAGVPANTLGTGGLMELVPADNRSTLLNVCEDVSRGCLALINCCNAVIGELPFKNEFFELYTNFTSQYQSINNTLPLMPLSQAFRPLTDKSVLLPTQKSNTNEYMYLNGVRSLFSKYSSPIQFEKLRGVKELVSRYNNLFSQGLPLNDSQMEKTTASLIQLLRYVVDFRRVNNEMSVVDLENPDLDIEIRKLGVNKDALSQHKDAHNQVVTAKDLDNDPIRSSAVFQIASTMTDLTSVVELTKSTDQPSQHKRLADVIRHGDDSSASRKRLRVKNIIDLNVVPINFNLLCREIPLTYLYNYSYTFDRMILELYGIPQAHYDIVKRHPLDAYPFRKESTYLFASMLMDPYKPLVNTRDVNVYLGKLMRGDNEMELGRAKYVSDQIYNKVMFRELYPIDNHQDDDIDPRYIMHNKVGGADEDVIPLTHQNMYVNNAASSADIKKKRMLALLANQPLMKMILDLYLGYVFHQLPHIYDQNITGQGSYRTNNAGSGAKSFSTILGIDTTVPQVRNYNNSADIHTATNSVLFPAMLAGKPDAAGAPANLVTPINSNVYNSTYANNIRKAVTKTLEFMINNNGFDYSRDVREAAEITADSAVPIDLTANPDAAGTYAKYLHQLGISDLDLNTLNDKLVRAGAGAAGGGGAIGAGAVFPQTSIRPLNANAPGDATYHCSIFGDNSFLTTPHGNLLGAGGAIDATNSTHALQGMFRIIEELSKNNPDYKIINYVILGNRNGFPDAYVKINFSFNLGNQHRYMAFASHVFFTNAIISDLKKLYTNSGGAGALADRNAVVNYIKDHGNNYSTNEVYKDALYMAANSIPTGTSQNRSLEFLYRLGNDPYMGIPIYITYNNLSQNIYPGSSQIFKKTTEYILTINNNRVPGDLSSDINSSDPRSPDNRPSNSFLTYIGEVDPSTARAVKVLRIDRGDINGFYKQYLRDLGKARFDTKLVRKLMFLVNIRRTLRYKLSKELLQHEGLITRSHQLIDPTTTEYEFNRIADSRSSTMTPYNRQESRIVM